LRITAPPYRKSGLLIAIFLGACDILDATNPAPRRASEHQAGTLIVGKPGETLGLDPAAIEDDESVEVCEQIYDHLVRYKPGSTEVEPDLATRWEVSEHGTVFTFHLRDGVKFHDGTDFDADAVVFSFERQRDPFHPYHSTAFTYWADQFQYIDKIEKVDRLTVRIEIERSFAPFLSSLAMFPVSIVSPTAVKKWGGEYGKHPVGTGPFKFVSWTPGDSTVLERNDDYFGEKAKIKRLVFKFIPDARQRLAALEGGAVDVAFAILPEELQYVELHPDLTLHRIDVQNVAYLAMNTEKAPWDDVAVRQAVNYAVNKVPIVKLVYQGLAQPAKGPLPPSIWSYRDDLPDYAYDPDKAKAILDEEEKAGKIDRKQVYKLYVPRTPRSYLPDPEAVAHVIQQNLAAIGIQTDLVVQDFGAHQADVQQGKHDLCLLGWTTDNGDPDNFLYVLLDRDNTIPGPIQDVAFYRNAELHGLLRYAQETLDQGERVKFYKRAQEIIHDDAPWVPLAHSELAVATRNDVEDLGMHPSATVYYNSVWLDR
jgi:peptide/nickel transport system substrate-binding protein